MIDIEVVEINDSDYMIIKEVEHNGESFLYLSNVNDEDDTLIRKTQGDMIVPLESEEEFEIACNLLVKEGMI